MRHATVPGLLLCLYTVLCLVIESCPSPCDPMDCSPPGSSVHGDSPGKNTGAGCHARLQEIFPTQGSNPGLLHCRWIFYHLSHQGSLWLYTSLSKLRWNSHDKSNHFKVNSSVAFSIFTVCQIHNGATTTSISKITLYPPHNIIFPGKQPLCSTCFPQHLQICFLSPWIYLFWTFRINGIISYMAFYVWLFSHSILFQGSSML